MPSVNDAPTASSRCRRHLFGWQFDVTGSTATVSSRSDHARLPSERAMNVSNTRLFTASNPTDGPLTYLWSITGARLSV